MNFFLATINHADYQLGLDRARDNRLRGGVVVMLVDAFAHPTQRWITGGISLAGLVAAAAATIWLWSSGQTAGDAFNGMIVLDELRLGFTLVFLLVSVLTMLISTVWVQNEQLPAGEFHSLLLFATVGMMLMASGGDLVIIFLGLEILSIATYVMAGFQTHRRALQRVVTEVFHPRFILIGISALRNRPDYGATATVGAGRGRPTLPTSPPDLTVSAVSGTALRRRGDDAGRFWFQDRHRAISRVDTGRLRRRANSSHSIHGGWSKGRGLCVVYSRLRVWVSRSLSLPSNSIRRSRLHTCLGDEPVVLAILTMTIGNVVAIAQNNVKRMLAYSSIAHAGYALVGMYRGRRNCRSRSTKRCHYRRDVLPANLRRDEHRRVRCGTTNRTTR